MPWIAAGALASLLAALAAGIYTWLTFRLVRSQSEPHVVVYAHHDDARPSLIEIVVKNIGHGLATNVSFGTSRPLPHRAFGVSVDTATPGATMSEGPLITGIPALAPGETRKILWGQFGGLQKVLAGETITVTCRYFHLHRRMADSVCYLEVHSFEATDASENELTRLVGEVRRLADSAAAIERKLPNS